MLRSVQTEGSGIAVAKRTEVAAQWDAEYLYVRFRCRGRGVAVHGSVHDAAHYEGEAVEVFLDAVGDERRFVELQLSPAGGVLDKLWILDPPVQSDERGVLTAAYIRDHEHEDLDWTLRGLRTAAAESMDGWIADFGIPWKETRGESPKAGVRLKAHFLRIARESMAAPRLALSWATVPPGRPHRAPALMGTLMLSAERLHEASP